MLNLTSRDNMTSTGAYSMIQTFSMDWDRQTPCQRAAMCSCRQLQTGSDRTKASSSLPQRGRMETLLLPFTRDEDWPLAIILPGASYCSWSCGLICHLCVAVRAESASAKQEPRTPTAVSKIAAAQTAARTTRRPCAAGEVTSRSCRGRSAEYLWKRSRPEKMFNTVLSS